MARTLSRCDEELAVPFWSVRRGAIIIALFLLCLPRQGFATTWLVEWEPDSPVDLVGSAVLQAASGDTVKVRPGVFFEHIPIDGKSLVIIGEGGPGSVILDGGMPIADRAGAVIYTNDDYHGTLVLQNLTITHGRGVIAGLFGGPRGGGLYLQHASGAAATLELRDCVIDDNAVAVPFGEGGGMFVGGCVDVLLVGSVFASNDMGFSYGGSILAALDIGPPCKLRMDDCTVIVDDPVGVEGLGLAIIGGSEVQVVNCALTSSVAGNTTGTYIGSKRVVVRGCRFIAAGGGSACSVHLTSPLGWGEGVVDIIVEGNRFWAEPSAEPPTALVFPPRESGITQVIDNALTGVDLYCAGDGTLDCRRNVIHRGVATMDMRLGVVACNITWPQSMTIDPGLAVDRNRVVDPLYCEDSPGRFGVSDRSPCLPDYSEGCGWIGSVPVECEDTPADGVSWGSIKNRLR